MAGLLRFSERNAPSEGGIAYATARRAPTSRKLVTPRRDRDRFRRARAVTVTDRGRAGRCADAGANDGGARDGRLSQDEQTALGELAHGAERVEHRQPARLHELLDVALSVD